MCHFLNCHIGGCIVSWKCYIKTEAFGMGFWIAEDGTLMSCPAVHHTMDIENAIAVSEWDDFSVYSHNHMAILAQIVGICTLKRDYVNIGYYAERFRTVA